jgi:rhamnosyl/mannosyltransferase
VLRRYGDKIAIIAGGIETSRFLPSVGSTQRARELRSLLAPSGPVLLFVGRLVYYKGVEFLVRAMSHVAATLLIVGRGDLHADLQRLVLQLGVEDRVRFLPDVPDSALPAYYQASDLLVLPSSDATEAFGLVQIEAHASGIPSICTDLPTGVTFANLHGLTGLVVRPGSAEALATAINRLLGDPQLRLEMGVRAQARAVAQFDIRRCATDVVGIYRELVPPGAAHVA